jgi:hypothetical protein
MDRRGRWRAGLMRGGTRGMGSKAAGGAGSRSATVGGISTDGSRVTGQIRLNQAVGWRRAWWEYACRARYMYLRAVSRAALLG